jgi:hypothetical protein
MVLGFGQAAMSFAQKCGAAAMPQCEYVMRATADHRVPHIYPGTGCRDSFFWLSQLNG